MDPMSFAIELRKDGYTTGWGDQNALIQLAQNNAYDQLVRLEAFDFDRDFWDDDTYDNDDLYESVDGQYVQLSFVESGVNDFSVAEDLWEKVKDQLQQEIPSESYDTWVKGAVGIAYDEDVLTIGVANEYARDWIEDRLAATIRSAMTGINARQSDVRFVVAEE